MLNMLELRAKMITGFVLVALITTAVGAIALRSMRKMAQADQTLYEDATVPLPELSNIETWSERMRVASRDFIAAQGNVERRATFDHQLNTLSANIDQASAAFEKRNLSPDMRKTLEEYKEARKAYAVYLGRIMDLANAGKDKEAWAILWSDSYNAAVNLRLQSIDRMEELKVAEAKEAVVRNEALANASTRQMIVAMAASLVLAIGCGILLTSVLVRPLDGYARFIHLSSDLFCIGTFDKYFKKINPSWERVLGFTSQELMAEPYTKFVHPDDRQSTMVETSRIQDPGTNSQAFENRFLCKDGSYKWLSWNAVSVPEEALTYAVARDITARKAADEVLRENAEQLRLLLDGVKDYAIFMLDPAGNVTTWNQGAARIKGYKADEIVGRHFSFFYPLEDVQNGKPEQELETAIAEGRYEEEGWRIRKDGSRFWANVVITPLRDAAGKLRGFSKITRDVTERKQTQQQIEQQNRELELRNRELDRATKLKSKFLASMSHELRTPLNAIVGFSDLLDEQTAGPLNNKQKRFVNHIKQGSAHLLQLINDILDLSKIEAGHIELRCEDFQIKDALPEVLSTLRPLAMAKNIQIRQSMETDQHVYADRVRFKQILYSLLSNAVKFTPKAGRIDIDCRENGTSVCISVADTELFEDKRLILGSDADAHAGHGRL